MIYIIRLQETSKECSDFHHSFCNLSSSAFVFPALLTATIYIFRVELRAEGSQHKSEEYLNLTLLSNASWPTFITMYPASVPRAAQRSILCPCLRLLEQSRRLFQQR